MIGHEQVVQIMAPTKQKKEKLGKSYLYVTEAELLRLNYV